MEDIVKNKIDTLQAIRALAFLGIFIAHSNITMFSSGGVWGVSVFLILSGFLMFYSYYDTERIDNNGIIYSLKFGINKIEKLYPLHIVTLLLAILDRYPDNGAIFKVATNAFLVQSWFPNGKIYFSLNAVSWYLSVSLFLYIMFPFILLKMRKYKGIKTAIVIIAVTFVIQMVLAFVSYMVQISITHNAGFIHWFIYIFPLSRLEDFVIGCNLGYIFMNAKKDKEISEKFYTLLELGIIIIIVIQWIAYVMLVSVPSKTDPSIYTENWWGLTGMWTLSSCTLVYVYALGKGKFSKILVNKFLLSIGNLSASAFLIHQMVYRYLNILENKFSGGGYKYINIFVCFIITIITAYVWDKYCKIIRKVKT